MRARTVIIGSLIAAAVVIALVFAANNPPATDSSGAGDIRIAAIGPGVGVILRDLGLEEFVVGRHGFDMALDPDLPVCGDLMGIDYEALLAVRPTHVYLEWDQREPPARMQELAASMGWEVEFLRLTSLAGIRDCTESLASTFVVETDLGDEMDRAWSLHSETLGDAGRVLLLVQTNPPAALGPGSYHHDILERIGGRGALQGAAPFVTMDVEDVLRLNPEVIVLVVPRERGADAGVHTPAQITAMLGPLAGKGIAAVENGRVAVIDDPLCQTASTALIGFADELAAILERWSVQAAQIDPKDADSAYSGGDD